MISQRASPAAWRRLDLEARWEPSGTDLVPSTERLVGTISAHDRRFLRALARDAHLLHNRWVSLRGVLEPRSATPFRALAEHCARLGWALSASIAIGTSRRDIDTAPAIARSLTHLNLWIAPKAALPSETLLEVVRLVAQENTGLSLCGGIDRFRDLGATDLPALQHRAHAFQLVPKGVNEPSFGT